MVYIILLRGINVSGKNKLPMKAFCDEVKSIPGIKHITHYIQSGNFIIQSNLTKDKLLKTFKIILKDSFSIDCEIFIYTKDEYQKINIPSLDNTNSLYISFANIELNITKEIVEIFKKHPTEEICNYNNYIWGNFPNGYGKAKLNNNYLEKLFNTTLTTRNYNTFKKILEMSNAII